MHRFTIICSLAVALSTFAGCREDGRSSEPVTIRLATTTSTENSGLLDVLLPAFERQTGIVVQVMSMGTGKALRTAANGDCDVVLVHARAAEEKFVANGHGVNRRDVMYNDFVLLGPAGDPAKVRGAATAAEALQRIAASKVTLCSRGDESGTHKKEMSLWQAAGIAQPDGAWYQETGQGMGATLTVANEKQAYVLADRGTYIAYRGKLGLAVLCEGDAALHNPYGVIAVSPEQHPHVNFNAAMKFIEFLTGPTGQEIIGTYRVEGEVLFHPHKGS